MTTTTNTATTVMMTKMSALSIFIGLTCLVAMTISCIVPEKEDQEVHVFHIGASKDSPNHETEVFELHVPEGRRKREASKHKDLNSCESDDDCPSGEDCSTETSKCQSSSQSAESNSELPRIIYRCLPPTL